MFERYEKEIYTIEHARQDYESYYKLKLNSMTKIKLKCWIAYCEYALREEKAEKAMKFDVYCNIVSPSTYISHIKSGEINCDDIGGKEESVEIVKRFFNVKE